MNPSDRYHIFNPDIAKNHGLNNAVFINQLISICNLYPNENKYFTLDNLEKIFPYWSRKTIRSITVDLTLRKLLITSKPNINKLDNTLHFSLSDNIYSSYGTGLPKN